MHVFEQFTFKKLKRGVFCVPLGPILCTVETFNFKSTNIATSNLSVWTANFITNYFQIPETFSVPTSQTVLWPVNKPD